MLPASTMTRLNPGLLPQSTVNDFLLGKSSVLSENILK